MIVVDASIAVDWYTDPTAAVPNAAFYEAIVSGAAVPGNFHGEAVQALLRAVRTGRMREVEMEANVADLDGLEFEVEFPPLGMVAHIAQKHELSAYDAAYIAVAKFRGIKLITRDAKLAKAAKAEGCLWTPPPPEEVEKKFSLLLAG
ncbi:MAG TPA: type II toxin-antitoxin system VapC family toxin [Candidatus Baltobacteraceae bacterium]|nr:type II toxin-antitoxin system VapC family toxin [Candidatus Baltobacteraceae bacterium]